MDERDQSERIGEAVRAAASTVHAPPALRARVAEQRLQAAVPARGRRRTARRLGPALAGAVAAVVLALALLPSGGGGGEPTIGEAAALALRAPTGPAPAPVPGDRQHLMASVGAIRFPNYDYDTRWRTAGVRRDRLGGRSATTVVYRTGGRRLGYTILDGRPLPEPAGARLVVRDGVRYRVLRSGGAAVVTWRRAGHTCVLATRDAGATRLLLRFATWA